MAKLPPEVRVHVARNTTQDVWEVESLLNVIHSEIEAREISDKVKAMASIEPRRLQNFSGNSKNSLATASAFLVDSKPLLPTPTCVYCSGKHFSASSESVTDISARKAILKRDRRCFTCLRQGHNVEQCDKSCRKCKRRHHQSICQEQNTNSSCNPQNSHSFASVDR